MGPANGRIPERRTWFGLGRSPVVAAAALCAAAAGAPAIAQQPEAREGASAVPAAVRISGVETLDERLVRDAVLTRPDRCRSVLLAPVCWVSDAGWAVERGYFDAAELPRDEERIRRLYASWGYPDAEVTSDTARGPDGRMRVRFQVIEREPVLVRSVELAGLDLLAEPVSLRDPLPIRPGEPDAPVRRDATERLIAAALAEIGHLLAEFEFAAVAVPDQRAVDLVITVRPGPVAVFGPTVALPGPPLRIDDVQRRLAYRPGERFRTSALEHTAERLYRVPLVERVFIEPLPSAEADTLIVTTIGITPGRTQGLQLGGAFSTTRCLEGTLGWGHRYLFGAPRVLQLSGGAANLLARPLRRFPCTGVGEEEFERLDYLLRAELREPIGADGWLLLTGAFSRETAPQAHIREGVQTRVGVSRMLGRSVDATVAFAPEWRDQLAAGPLFCGLYGICGADAVAALSTRTVLAPAELAVGWTPPSLRRPPAPPPAGPAWMHPPVPGPLFSLRLALGGAAPATGSEFRFARADAVGTAVFGRGRRVELAGRLRLAGLFAEQAVPPYVRVYGGGPIGVRGAPAFQLGPKVLTVPAERVEALGCEPVPGGCEGMTIDPDLVRPRPTGGARLLESSLEGRWWATDELQLAAFVDWGGVGNRAEAGAPAAAASSETMWAPGLGVLVLSPFGPVRADVAYDPSPARRYPLLTRVEETGAQLHLGDVVWDPYRFGGPSRLGEGWRRLQFQLQMGLPF